MPTIEELARGRGRATPMVKDLPLAPPAKARPTVEEQLQTMKAFQEGYSRAGIGTGLVNENFNSVTGLPGTTEYKPVSSLDRGQLLDLRNSLLTTPPELGFSDSYNVGADGRPLPKLGRGGTTDISNTNAMVDAGLLPENQREIFPQTGAPSLDPYAAALSSQLDFFGQRESDLQNQLREQSALGEQRVQDQLSTVANLLDTQFAPEFQRVAEQTERASGAANLGAAGRGSVRGSRQEQVLLDLEDKANQARKALNAERALQLQLAEAQLRGQPNEVLRDLQNQLTTLQSKKAEALTNLELARQGALEAQIETAAEAEANQLASLNDFYAAQGLALNPITGEAVSTLEGQQAQADILKTIAESAKLNAQELEIFDKIDEPNVDLEYFTNESGEVVLSIFDKDTREQDALNLGPLGRNELFVLQAKGALSGGKGGGSGRGDATPSGFISQLATQLRAQGYTTADLTTGELSDFLGKLKGNERSALFLEMAQQEGDEASLRTLGPEIFSNKVLPALTGKTASERAEIPVRRPSLSDLNPSANQAGSFLSRLLPKGSFTDAAKGL